MPGLIDSINFAPVAGEGAYSRKNFVFSLFCKTEWIKDILMCQYYTNSDGTPRNLGDSIGFYQRYLITQLDEFHKILNLPEWNEYGIIHLLDVNLLNLKYYRTINNVTNIIDQGLTVQDVITRNMLPHIRSGKYKLLSYDITNLNF